MSVRRIVLTPNKILEEKCQKVTNFDESIKDLAQDLIDTVKDAKNPEGAGLAAPQIGVLKRVCVVRQFFSDPQNPEMVSSKEFVLINPEIISESNEKYIDIEGCLSIPDTYGKVERYENIEIEAQNVNGEKFKINANDFFGRVIQHEIDHLDGILFTTKIIGETYTGNQLDEMEDIIPG